MAWCARENTLLAKNGLTFGAECLAFTSSVWIHHRAIPIEAPWQNRMVDRHAQVISGIVRACCEDASIVGPEPMQHVLLHATLANTTDILAEMDTAQGLQSMASMQGWSLSA